MEDSRLPVLVIDGAAFDDFEGFQRVFSTLLNDWDWNGSLDAATTSSAVVSGLLKVAGS